LKTFLEFLSSIHNKIQFTMEMEEGKHLRFIDIDVYRRPDGTLGHRVYRKPVHTSLYLHPISHHHPSNKHAVLATLVFRAGAICDENILGQELEFLKNSLRDNSYSLQQIQHAFSRKEKPPRDNKKPILTAFLPYVQSMYCHLNRMLKKLDFRGINLPPKKIFKCLRPVKDNMGLKTAGVYCIPCECCKVCVGQSGRTIEMRVEEHRWHICHFHPDKSAVAKHSINHDHKMRFQETQILGSKSGYMDRLIREAKELDLHPNNINQENGLLLRKTWKPAIQQLRRNRPTSRPN
jgi:hypothetical protein